MGAAAVLLLGAVVYPKTCGRGESERAVRLSNTLLAALTLKRQGVSFPLDQEKMRAKDVA